MSSAAVPPEQVKRLRSTSKSSAVTSICGKSSAEAGEVLPVDRAAIAVEQPGPRQDMAPGAERADIRPLSVEAAECCKERAVGKGMPVDAAAEHDRAEAGCLLDTGFGPQLDAVAGGDRLAVRREQVPAIELAPARAVGEPKRLDRRGEGDHREARHQQEGDALRQLVGNVAEHEARAASSSGKMRSARHSTPCREMNKPWR